MLRQVRQSPQETVAAYSERLWRIAEQAYPDMPYNKETTAFMEKQLVDIFADGLHYDYLRMKVLRETPKTYEAAVESAVREQNLRKRFNLRTETTNNYYPQSYQETSPSWSPTVNNWPQAAPNWSQPQPNVGSRPLMTDTRPLMTDTRHVEAMEIDHVRSQRCYKCEGRGHRAKDCPTGRPRENPRQVFVVEHHSDNDEEPSPSSRAHANFPVNKNLQAAKRLSQQGSRPPGQSRNREFNGNRQHNIPPEIPDWIKGAECWICHMIGHLRRNCPQRGVPDRNRVPTNDRDYRGGPRYKGRQDF
jgi:hypothetical protein